ncbi:hypothetical protein LGR54_04440 [Ancylobacter sp. Lp-2]|uniref:hypothetical protein n=1 Tax=Ancylobacter sp. Lp-2 TaxID=2881339 RepID=UPI001E610490|nr:hypothetical protein [Ancylobacter sp. Lp-2]MCB4767843.1 hypothetical protein [Ancylobacter sp. Lp-2]
MKIIGIRPAEPGGSDLARLDVETSDGIKLYDLTLKRTPDGALRLWAPNAFGRRCAAIPTRIADALAADAVSLLRSREPNDRRVA